MSYGEIMRENNIVTITEELAYAWGLVEELKNKIEEQQVEIRKLRGELSRMLPPNWEG